MERTIRDGGVGKVEAKERGKVSFPISKPNGGPEIARNHPTSFHEVHKSSTTPIGPSKSRNKVSSDRSLLITGPRLSSRFQGNPSCPATIAQVNRSHDKFLRSSLRSPGLLLPLCRTPTPADLTPLSCVPSPFRLDTYPSSKRTDESPNRSKHHHTPRRYIQRVGREPSCKTRSRHAAQCAQCDAAFDCYGQTGDEQ